MAKALRAGEAIKLGISKLQSGDLLLVAGKGTDLHKK